MATIHAYQRYPRPLQDGPGPQERYDREAKILKSFDDEYQRGIVFKKIEYKSGAREFVERYGRVIHALERVRDEEYRDDIDQIDGLRAKFYQLFEIIYKLFRWTEVYLRKYGHIYKSEYLNLYWLVRGLAKKADHGEGLIRHIINMNELLDLIRPAPMAVWLDDGSDLRPNWQFDDICKSFGMIPWVGGIVSESRVDNENYQDKQELYVCHSYAMLKRALQLLDLPDYLADPEREEVNFFYNETRPTYVEYPYGSDEFLYGFGGRPGILQMRAMLGGRLPRDVEAKVNWVHEWGGPGPQGISRAPHRNQGRISLDKTGPKTSTKQTAIKNKPKDKDSNKKAGKAVLPTPSTTSPLNRPAGGSSSNFAPSSSLARNSSSPVKGNGKGRKRGRDSTHPRPPPPPGAPAAKRQRTTRGYTMTIDNATLEYSSYDEKEEEEDDDDEEQEDEDEDAGDVEIQDAPGNAYVGDVTVNLIITAGNSDAEEAEAEAEAQAQAETTNDTANGVIPIEKPIPNSQHGVVLTASQIRRAEIVLQSALNRCILPDASDYIIDTREEGRRRRWHEDAAEARLAGNPAPRWTHRVPSDIFAAGGPPNWQKMPKKTAWDRLMWMWVMTYWRFWQLRELDP